MLFESVANSVTLGLPWMKFIPSTKHEWVMDYWSQNWLSSLCTPTVMVQTRLLKPKSQRWHIHSISPSPGAKKRIQNPDPQSRVLSTLPAYIQGSLTKGPGENIGSIAHPRRTQASSRRRHVCFNPAIWMCLKTETVCSFPQFQSRNLIAWTQERQSCQIRGRASLYSKSLKFSRAEITYSSTQERQLWQNFWNHDSNWESGKICHLSFPSTGDRLISPFPSYLFCFEWKRSIFLLQIFFFTPSISLHPPDSGWFFSSFQS